MNYFDEIVMKNTKKWKTNECFKKNGKGDV